MNRQPDPAAARALAHQAFDDEAVFDTLVAEGAVESSLRDPAFRAALAARERRKYWLVPTAGAAVGAAATLLTFFVLRPSPHPIQHRVQQVRVIPNVLLSSDLKPAVSPNAPVFRGSDAASRPPRSDGTITSVEDGIATVNLGSLDGLAKGTELEAAHGHIVITTVFRDRSRGRLVAGAAAANDPVRVPNAVHLSAILEQVDALAASGNLQTARDVARNALTIGTSGETRQLLEKLAALDYQAGAPDAARERYEVAVNNFDQPPSASPAERAATLANYGALALLNGDQRRAEDLLQKALPLASDPALRSQISANLAVAHRP
jgi:hypothetical protein